MPGGWQRCMPGSSEPWVRRAWRRVRSTIRREPEDVQAAIGRWWPAAEPAQARPSVPWDSVVDQLLRHGWTLSAGTLLLERGEADRAMDMAARVLARRRDASTLQAACRIAYQAAQLGQAGEWADALEAAAPSGGVDQRLIAAIRERCAVLARLERSPQRASVTPAPRRVLALLAYRLPYTSNGYATRSHGLLTAVHQLGWDVHAYSRPGYPEQAAAGQPDAELPLKDRVGELEYGRMARTERRRFGHMPYLLAAADEIAQKIAELRPAVVHAASNYMTALPACIAAHEAGLPFVYEVRGFWDVTRASSDPAFATTAEYRHLRHFEARLLRQADAVVTLTGAMRDELIRRGAPADRIEVAPNAVDLESLRPRPASAELAHRLGLLADRPVIGYVGSFVDYEGLDDLVSACAELARAGRAFHLLLVGDGLALPTVQQGISEHGLAPHTTLTGRVPHEEVADYYALMDICAFPRKAWPVCELVSPLKPFEAMALEKAVLVSSVAAMAETIEEGVNGRVFAKGSVSGLAAALASLLDDLPGARAMGRRAREWVRSHRTWQGSARAVERAYLAATRHRAERSIGDNP